MKIKYIFIFINLLVICSCSVLTKSNTIKQQTGRVFMNETDYPLSVNIDVYQNENKIISTKSNSSGFFQFSTNQKYNKGLTFIIPKNDKTDTIHNVKGFKYILFKCYISDTINVTNDNINDTIILFAKKCKLLIIPDKAFREH